MPSGPADRTLPGGAQPPDVSSASTGGKIFSSEPSGREVLVPGHGSNERMRRAMMLCYFAGYVKGVRDAMYEEFRGWYARFVAGW